MHAARDRQITDGLMRMFCALVCVQLEKQQKRHLKYVKGDIKRKTASITRMRPLNETEKKMKISFNW